jgi:hypothetical protein
MTIDEFGAGYTPFIFIQLPTPIIFGLYLLGYVQARRLYLVF